ncbi:MAG: ATP-binding protein [Cardiobacteriaceae bacterium]|nr:ATP-binding protein [Cardiobacteriaceae bacterium]
MERFLIKELIAWKTSIRRKPLILNGVRQVGKTWLLREFGAQHFDNVVYVNFDNNPQLTRHFDDGYDIARLISVLQVETHQKINPQSTLVIFDEIQECPKALTALKYFYENAPEYAVTAAGSLLGLLIHEGTGFPVGKVDTLNLYPLTFREFLNAIGEQILTEAIDSRDYKLIDTFAVKLINYLRQYYFVGGMPEAVHSFCQTGDFARSREIQKQIIYGYERDMSKHLSVKETEAVLSAWHSIPAHLSQENKRFIFGHIKKSARARDYQSAITWLTNAGLALLIPRVSKPAIPLSAYADRSIFKLFLVDVGLLAAISGLDAHSLIEGNAIFSEFKGALTEQYVAQELVASIGVMPFYWSAENSRGEIDFLVQQNGRIYPIEVKAEENLKAKSLRAFSERYQNLLALRFSLSGYREENWMCNIPLYGIFLPSNSSSKQS